MANRPGGRLAGWFAARNGLLEALALLGVLATAVALRLVGLGNDTDVSDEGIRGLQLRLMAVGYRPVSEIYASQGPLSLYLFYPLYQLFGGGIIAARLAVVAYSLLGIVGLFWLGRRLAGPLGGLAAAGLLAVSPVYLEKSRLALVEVPSIAPAILSLLLLLRYRDAGGRGWLVGSAALLAVAGLAKPMALTAGVAAALLIVGGRAPSGAAGRSRFGARLRDLLLYGAVGAAVCGLVVALIGPAQVYDQIVGYRLAARAARGWDLATNVGILWSELAREGPGLLVAAGAGAVLLVGRRSLAAVAVLAWLAAGLGLLLLYSPLFPKHVVYLLPPLALLAGAGLGEGLGAALAVLRGASNSAVIPNPFVILNPSVILSAAKNLVVNSVRFFAALRMTEGVPVAAIAAVTLTPVLYLASLPLIALEDGRILAREAGEDAERYSDDLRVVEAVAGPDDFIVMDDAYLALQSGRLVPPLLADLSWNRILARALTAEQAVAETTRFGARAVLAQDAHLGQLPRYLGWVDREYVLVKSYVQRRPNRFRRVYVRPDADLAAARVALAAGIETPLSADFGPARLLGYSLDRRELRAGGRFGLTLHWEAPVGSPPEHHMVVRLRTADGEPAHEGTWRVGDAGQVFETWEAGRWMFQSLRILVDDETPPGAYGLTLALVAPKAGPAPIHGEVRTWRGGGAELELGQLTVR